jgi:hypothetical protein
MGPLILLILFAAQTQVEASSALTARSLQRSELPDYFPLRVLDIGFAVIEVTLENGASEAMRVDPEQFEAFAPRGRRLEPAALTDVVPELVKFHSRSGGAGMHGEVYRRAPPYPYGGPHRTPQTTGPVTAGPRSVSASLATEIRESLEMHLLQESTLKAGEKITGLLIFKSRQSGNRLAGGRVVFQDLQSPLK